MRLQDVKNHGLLIKQHRKVFCDRYFMIFFFPGSCVCYSACISTPSTRMFKLPSSVSLLTTSLESTVQHLSSCTAHLQHLPALRLTRKKKKIHGTSFKISLGSETRREEICQGSSTELLALLAPPITQSSSLPPFF